MNFDDLAKMMDAEFSAMAEQQLRLLICNIQLISIFRIEALPSRVAMFNFCTETWEVQGFLVYTENPVRPLCGAHSLTFRPEIGVTIACMGGNRYVVLDDSKRIS